MTTRRLRRLLASVTIGVLCACPAAAQDEKLPDSDVLMRALVDELNRSLTLQMEDLEQPYFIQFDVDDSLWYRLSATYGSLTSFDRDRSRTFYSRVRVGSPELDNTNFAEGGRFTFGSGGGGRAQTALPIDDDYVALRQAIWRTADADYKSAVETLTRKKAYMKDKNIAERANDFSSAPPVQQTEPAAVLHLDPAQWQEHLQQISAHFKKFAQVQDSSVRLMAGAGNSYIVNSEGTRLRTGDTAAMLLITAQVQADDGMRLSNSRTYLGSTTADFPPLERILRDVNDMVAELTAVMQAPVIEHYSGPVLFDGLAAAQMFRALLAGGVVGKPDPVGEQRRARQGGENLENKLGTRILPKSFQVWDDPTGQKYGDETLLGHYRYDDEGVPAQRVNLVIDGKLDQMCLARAPTKKLSGSNGHARRSPGAEAPEPAIGCLFIKDNAGLPDPELKAALTAAAKEAGLEYGVRIKLLRAADATSTRADLVSFVLRRQRGGGRSESMLGDPVVAYKVYASDGHEEPFRGCEFGPVEVAALRKIAAAGNTPKVYNYMGVGLGGAAPAATIVAPPVLFEELELSQIQQEHDKPPLLKAPLSR